MTKELFAEVLKDAYIVTEFPNRDKNVLPKDLKGWFRQAFFLTLSKKSDKKPFLTNFEKIGEKFCTKLPQIYKKQPRKIRGCLCAIADYSASLATTTVFL